MTGPDFSDIDSRAKAEELSRRGDLEQMRLLPEPFGGSDDPRNLVYVPVGIAGIKADVDANVIAPLAAKGKVTRYTAEPEYEGKSFIPIAIRIEAFDPGRFIYVVKIWGTALTRDAEA